MNFAIEMRLIREFKEYVYTMPKLKRLIVEDVNMHFKIYDALLSYFYSQAYAKEENKLQKQNKIIENIKEIYEFKMEESLSNLSIIASISPFIGLFGTVWGIMNSFQSIASAHSTSIAIVAPGISEALFATAVGLFVAIPASIAAHLFYSKIEQVQKDASIFGAYIMDKLESKTE
jgi:biopolymer transport protein ExbB/TolQ